MTNSLIASTLKEANGGGTSPAIDTTGANLIFVTLVQGFSSNVTISDNKGNTYTTATGSASPDVLAKGSIAYCLNGTVGTGHTFTASGGNNQQAFCVAAFKTILSANGGPDPSGSVNPGTTVQPGAKTPSGSPGLLIVNYCQVPSVVGDTFISVDSGFSLPQAIVASGPTYVTALAYLFQTVATSANPTGTSNRSNALWATQYSFTAQADGKPFCQILG